MHYLIIVGLLLSFGAAFAEEVNLYSACREILIKPLLANIYKSVTCPRSDLASMINKLVVAKLGKNKLPACRQYSYAYKLISVLLVCLLSFSAHAVDDHIPRIFHDFNMETGIGVNSNNEEIVGLDFVGSIGTDTDKLWLQSKLERTANHTEQLEFWGLYGSYLTTFWDAQIGIRYDKEPENVVYAVIAASGLAKYFLDTEVYIFVSGEADVSVRLQQKIELIITQRAIAEPYFEVNMFAQDVPELERGAGISNIEIGLHMRYEITRRVAPYFVIKYEHSFGETASILKNNNTDHTDIIAMLGIKFLF